MATALGPTLFASEPAGLLLPPPYAYLTLDLETNDGRPEQAVRWMRLYWHPNNDWKEQTVGKRYFEALEKLQERLALLNESPIVCVSLKSDTELRCLHSMQAEEPRELAGGLVEGFETSAEMLLALRNVLDRYASEDTVLVGHNILSFDLRKLRWAYVRHGLRMPYCLAHRGQPVFDLMREYHSRFSLKSEGWVALDDLLEEFAIESHKPALDGSQIPALVQAGEYEAIVQYALLDVLAEAELYLRMSGQVEDRR